MCQVFQESFDIRDEPNNSNLHLYCEPNWTACFSGSYFFFWKRSIFLSSDDSVLGMKRLKTSSPCDNDGSIYSEMISIFGH